MLEVFRRGSNTYCIMANNQIDIAAAAANIPIAFYNGATGSFNNRVLRLQEPQSFSRLVVGCTVFTLDVTGRASISTNGDLIDVPFSLTVTGIGLFTQNTFTRVYTLLDRICFVEDAIASAAGLMRCPSISMLSRMGS